MTEVLIAELVLLAGVAGTVSVLIRDPSRQAISLSAYGAILVVLFVALQAPDVALSEAVVGGIALPALLLVAITRIRDAADADDG